MRSKEPTMNTMIDLNSELLIDRSRVRNPYLRLLLTALGQELAKGSPWVAVNKRLAAKYDIFLGLPGGHVRQAAA
jgi:hypothetical protein